jgi:AraC-like DNA-binding protein
MLTGRGQARFGTATIRSTVLFERRFWAYIVDREGLVYDTRLVAGAPGRSPNTVIYLLLHGTFEVFAPVAQRFEGPAAFVLDEEQLEGEEGRRSFLFRASGSPFAAIELRLRKGDTSYRLAKRPAPFDLDARAWEAAHRVGSLHGTTPGTEALLAADLLDGLARSGVVPPDIASRDAEDDERFVRLWSALAPMMGRFYSLPTLQEVARGSRMSLRQTAREMTEFFDAFHFIGIGSGWREATRRLRLKLAALGLSAEDTTVGEVARVAGYGSSEAMARAFRDVGMLAPVLTRAALRNTEP